MGQVWVSRALTCWSFLRIFGIHFRPMVQEEVFVYIMILCSFQSWRYNHDSTISFMCVFVETAGGFAKHVILHRLLTLKSSAQLEWESRIHCEIIFSICHVQGLHLERGIYTIPGSTSFRAKNCWTCCNRGILSTIFDEGNDSTLQGDASHLSLLLQKKPS